MPRDDDMFEDSGDEGGGLVGRFLKRSVGAPTAALGYLGEQFNGWKSEFMSIFQTEIRRFLDRVNPSEELEKLGAGKRLEISASIRLVDDDRPRPAKRAAKSAVKGASKTAPAKSGSSQKTKKSKQRRDRG